MEHEQSFARLATKCTAGFVAVLVVVLGAFWGIPSSAGAAVRPALVAPPGPVNPFPWLPSGITKVLTDVGRPLVPLAQAAVEAGTKAMPLTDTAAMTRVGGGSIVAGGMFGWMFGDATLKLYATMTQTEDIRCGAGVSNSWYKALDTSVTFGLLDPTCAARVAFPNTDVTAVWFAVVEGVTYKTFFFDSGGFRYYCVAADAVPRTAVRLQLSVPVAGGGYTSPWHQEPQGLVIATRAACAINSSDLWFTRPAAQQPLGSAFFDWADTSAAHNRFTGFRLIDVNKTQGDPSRVLGVSSASNGDPSRTPDCKITWSDGTTTTGTGSAYHESAGVPTSAAGLGCEQAYTSKPGGGPTLLPSKIDVDSTDETGAKTQISSQTVPSFTATEVQAMQPTKPSEGLVLRKTIGAVTDSCMTWAADCSNWWTKTSSGTVPTTGTETFKCTYGGDPVGLDQCGVYRHTFDTQTETPVITDPRTGTDSPWVASQPNNAGSTDPGAGIDPGGQCMSEWPSAADPITWVLLPLKCAFVWAFVPRPSVVTATQTAVATAWAPTAVGQIGALVPTWLTVPTGTGCEGPHVYWVVEWPTHIVMDAHPLSACAEPAATYAALARLIASIMLIGYTIFGVSRRLSSIVSAPGVGPGG